MLTIIIMRDEYDFSAGKRGPVLKKSAKTGDSIVDLPVVCTLTPTTIATRKAALLPGLARQADSREERATGVRLRLPADALPAVWRPLTRSGNAADSCGLTSPSSLAVARFGWKSPARPVRGSSYPRFSNREHESAGLRDGGAGPSDVAEPCSGARLGAYSILRALCRP